MKGFFLKLALELFGKLEELATSPLGESVETLTDVVSVFGHRFKLTLTASRES